MFSYARGVKTLPGMHGDHILRAFLEIFLFFSYKGLFDTLVFHKGVNSITADESSPLVPTRCLLFLVTNGNLTLFSQGSKFS